MKAYLIDTPNKQIVEVEYNGDWKTISPEHLKCEVFTTVRLNLSDDCVYVDDEGLINGNEHGWFTIDTYGQPLRGYGLVLGVDEEGETVEPSLSLEELRAKIGFPSADTEFDIDTGFRIVAL